MPSSRISVKRRAGARPRVETYCTLLLLLLLLQLVELADLLRRRLGVRRLLFLRRRPLFRRFLRRNVGSDEHGEKQLHSSSSSRMRVTWPTTVGSFSILAIAWSTFFSSARCVSM